MAEWLRDAYLELTQKTPLDFEKLRPAEPYSIPLDGNWEAVANEWKEISRDGETLADILYLHWQLKVTASISLTNRNYYCNQCHMHFGASYGCLSKRLILAIVDEAFRGELESLKENSA